MAHAKRKYDRSSQMCLPYTNLSLGHILEPTNCSTSVRCTFPGSAMTGAYISQPIISAIISCVRYVLPTDMGIPITFDALTEHHRTRMRPRVSFKLIEIIVAYVSIHRRSCVPGWGCRLSNEDMSASFIVDMTRYRDAFPISVHAVIATADAFSERSSCTSPLSTCFAPTDG